MSVRVRTSFIGALAVGAALTIASVALLRHLERNMIDNAQVTASVRASDAVTLLRDGDPPRRWKVPDDRNSFVQVVSGGRVVVSTSNVSARVPVTPPDGPRWRTVHGVAADPDAPFRVFQMTASADGRPYTVLSGSSMDDAEDTLTATRTFLVSGVPVVVLLVAFVTWLATGRALRPVEAMRAEVESITTRGLHRRVPQPPGTDEISRLAGTMNDMLARLEQSVASQRDFVADASHELRNPLAALRAELEIALAHPDRAEWPSVVADALGDTRRIEELARNLLLLARLDSSTSKHELVDLTSLTVEAMASHPLRPSLARDVAADPDVIVHGDTEQLRRLINNLLDNAARHAKSQVRVTLRRASAAAVLAVADDGPGIPRQDRERIFNRFVRLDDARSRDAGGSGLGLAIVRDIATAHGASIIVDGDRQGAVFRLIFTSIHTRQAALA
jgi:signal transduction histidine kinase